MCTSWIDELDVLWVKLHLEFLNPQWMKGCQSIRAALAPEINWHEQEGTILIVEHI